MHHSITTGLVLAIWLTAGGLVAVAQTNAGNAATGTVTEAGQLLKDLEKRMSGVKTVQAAFVEEKELKILSKKVVLEGRIAFENPGRLAWHVSKPVRYSMLLTDTIVKQWDEDTGKVQKVSLSSNPAFKMVTQQLGSWFSGRYASLAADYDVTVLAREPGISLRFTPKAGSGTAKAIQSVVVVFQEDQRYVSGITITDISGDATRMTFVNTRLNEPIPDSLWEVEPRD